MAQTSEKYCYSAKRTRYNYRVLFAETNEQTFAQLKTVLHIKVFGVKREDFKHSK
ncbi:MAG: hypothetical protein PHQ52_06670 [Candidatus Omnitrophica bacterium]|nr:hypothetical protein [Candidatus Omnitrophota bacterium]